MNNIIDVRPLLAALACAALLASGTARAEEQAAAATDKQHLQLVSLRSSVVFAFKQSQLAPAAQREIEALGAALANLPRAQITVSGYADVSGPGEINLQLSQWRAEGVAQALAAAGVDPARIRLEANGEWFSQQVPATPAAQAQQRRVDIRVEQQL